MSRKIPKQGPSSGISNLGKILDMVTSSGEPSGCQRADSSRTMACTKRRRRRRRRRRGVCVVVMQNQYCRGGWVLTHRHSLWRWHQAISCLHCLGSPEKYFDHAIFVQLVYIFSNDLAVSFAICCLTIHDKSLVIRV